MPVETDVSTFPLVVSHFGGAVAPEDLHAFLASFGERLKQGRPHAMVLDFTGIVSTNSEYRHVTAQFNREHHEELRRCVVGMALVTQAPIVRAIIKAIYWVAPPPHPYLVCADLPVGTAWARAQLVRHGLLAGSPPGTASVTHGA